MRSVFASPGTPTMRLLPPVNSESSTSSIASCWPTMSLRSSVMIASCSLLRRRARSRSSCLRFGCGAAVGARDDVEADVVERMKDRMARLQPDELIAGEHALHLRDRIEPIALIEAAHLAEVVEDGEAALEEIIPESRDFFVVRRPAA